MPLIAAFVKLGISFPHRGSESADAERRPNEQQRVRRAARPAGTYRRGHATPVASGTAQDRLQAGGGLVTLLRVFGGELHDDS